MEARLRGEAASIIALWGDVGGGSSSGTYNNNNSTPTAATTTIPYLDGLLEPGLLDVKTLGSAKPLEATFDGSDQSTRPFACPIRIEVRGQTAEQAIEQGEAVVSEVQQNFVRGPVATSAKVLRPGAQHYVMWENLGAHAIRLQPNKSNSIVWLNKANASKSESDPSSEWPAQRDLITRVLPYAASWVRVLELAREDGGIDIKDDCRLDDRSAKCHQDGNNAVSKGRAPPIIRLAVNVSSRKSGRSLDYLDISTDGMFVDGEERKAALVYSVSQDGIWHGAAQTTYGYIQGVSQVCHGSSSGNGPCLKRIITVFELPFSHPLSGLSAIQRLHRIGVIVYAIDPKHQLTRSLGGAWFGSSNSHSPTTKTHQSGFEEEEEEEGRTWPYRRAAYITSTRPTYHHHHRHYHRRSGRRRKRTSRRSSAPLHIAPRTHDHVRTIQGLQ